MTTYSEAIDLMYATFKNAWDTNSITIVGYLPNVEYEGVPQDDDGTHADTNKYWARLSVRNVTEDQATLGSPEVGKHEYETVGIITIELYGPKQDNTAITKLRKLGEFVRNAYRSVASGGEVCYREVTLRERGGESRWRRVDVTAVYTFMETV